MQQFVRARGFGLAAIGLALGLFPFVSAAQDDPPVPKYYLGALGGYMFPDAARDADGGYNLHGVGGVTLAESLAIELNAFGSSTNRKTDSSQSDSYMGGGIDLALGTPAPGNPFFLIGGGAIEQDIYQVSKTSAYGSLGLGVYLPFSLAGELWRLEGRYNVVFNEHPALATEDLLDDGRVNFGVLFTFGKQAVAQAAVEEQSEAAAAEAPAAPASEPTSAVAIADADGDGVADGQDQCPDTPRWIRPDANGCTPDSDGDGVDEARDDCPGTPTGTQVDAEGCEPKPEVAQGPLDEDHDGVVDGQDACPRTIPRYDIDEKGCIKPEDVTLRAVHFDLESSRLTGDGYKLLRQVGASLAADPRLRLEVGGHADSTGQNQFNTKLSLERAEVVRDFLSYLGIAEDRFTVKGYGETKPLSDNKTDEARAMNRRVEFRRID
jgi:outer membrane protein OmpA-like peptidoglycan-associated protein